MGEASQSWRKLIGLVVVSNAGVGFTLSKIGMKLSETRTEGIMNRTKPEGSPNVMMNWAIVMPAIWTIM